MLVFLTVVVIGVVGFACWREGVLTAFTILCNVFLAGLVAFGVWEPLADELGKLLEGSFLAGYEDALCLFVLFSGTLALLRVLTNNLAPRQPEYHPILQQAGSVVCALVAGYLVSGFLVCVLQTMPLQEKFMGFNAREPIEANRGGLRSVLPPDRVWLALMHRASMGPLSLGEAREFDEEGSFELRYQMRRAERAKTDASGG
jgi:hypothetical protein